MKLRLCWIVVGLGCLFLGQPASFAQGKADKAAKKPKSSKPKVDEWGKTQENKPYSLNESDQRNRAAPQVEAESIGWLLMKVVLYLLLVLGLLYASAWMVRRFLPARQALMGHSAITVLGRSHLSTRMQIYLVQVGSQILVIGVTADQMTTLSTITDPEDVKSILGASEPAPGAGKGFEGLFKKAVSQYEGEPTPEFEREADLLRETMGQRRKEGSA